MCLGILMFFFGRRCCCCGADTSVILVVWSLRLLVGLDVHVHVDGLYLFYLNPNTPFSPHRDEYSRYFLFPFLLLLLPQLQSIFSDEFFLEVS